VSARPQTTGEIESLRALAYEMLRREPAAREPHLRLYEVEQMLGRPEVALAHLRRALERSRVVTLPATRSPAELTVLALSRVGAWEANAPLELVIDAERTTLQRYYLDDDDDLARIAEPFPAHDVVFNTIAESEGARAALALAGALLARSGERAVNPPERVADLSRPDVARRFAGSSTILTPAVERLGAAEVRARPLREPIVIRPVGSQAGYALERIDAAPALEAYLAAQPHEAYFVMPFVDYRNDDGFYRKYRVMFVGGTPYACHLAISPRWMIHYYNAAMAEHAWMREEEARFVADLDATFAGPPAAALREIAAIELDYFGIDCAITREGRLLLFEADAAMLVHGSDPPDLYPYKPAAFARIRAALHALLLRRARSG